MSDDTSHSRRRALQLVGGGTVGALAGCFGILSGSKPTVFTDITVRDEKIVVGLKDGTKADVIDLRSPTDELLNTARIGRKSRVAFPLYAGTNTPLAPGKYTLVAVETSGEGESHQLSTRTIDLTMSLSIVDVRIPNQSIGGGPPTVAITLKNTGELPIKLDYMGFPKGVPSPSPAPSEPDSPIPDYLSTSGTGQIVPVGTTTTFESANSPLRSSGTPEQGAVGVPKQGASWEQLKRNHCNGEQYPATLVVIPKYGHAHRRTVTFKYGGDVARRSAGPGYFCTRATVVSVERKSTATKGTSNSEDNA